MRVLVVDVGGTHVKLMHSGSPEARKFDSGDGFTPQQVVAGVKANTADWKYDVITIGIPSPVLRGQVMEEPWNLGKGWVGFDWADALRQSPSTSSTTPRCRRSAATKAAACCSSASGRDSAPRSSTMGGSSRSSSRTCRIRARRSRMCSASAA